MGVCSGFAVLVLATLSPRTVPAQVAPPYFGIRVVDEQTGCGVPLIELRTTNGIAFHTDSGGWVDVSSAWASAQRSSIPKGNPPIVWVAQA